MSKIHVEQIAKATDGDGNIDTEYLDSYGRVWYDAGKSVIDEERTKHDGSRPIYKWVSNWKQVDLPEDPTYE